MPALELVKNYLRIDYDFDDNLITFFIEVAESYMRGALDNYNALEKSEKIRPKLEMCQLVIIQDLYENRNQAGYGVRDFGFTIRSLIGQLQLEEVEEVVEEEEEEGDL